ncbi:Prolyl oligopeptidase family protein [Alteromonadaceae bacterium Bs31]|nr:Prolyl oligopeptidase family protein [Alteromonadaceae bacterium Bs31]
MRNRELLYLALGLASSTLLACTSLMPKTHFEDIQATQISCFDYPFEIDPKPTTEKALEKIERLNKKLECYWFTYFVDDIEVTGFYLKPRGVLVANLPVVVLNRGGNARSPNKINFVLSRAVPLVKEGYVVIGSLYRGARITQKPNEQELLDEFGGADVNDVLALLPIIDTMPFADKESIAIYGVSRGAMMSYRAAAQTERFKALVSVAGPVDLIAGAKQRPKMEKFVFSKWIPDYWQNKDAELKKRSALYWPEKLPAAMPVLIIHGSEDKKVAPSQAIQMAEALSKAGIPNKLTIIQGADHGLNKPYRKEANTEIIQWLNKYVKSPVETQLVNR